MTAAESFAKDVTYIAVSSLGGQVELDLQSGLPGIRPKTIRPHWVVVPILYSISRSLAGAGSPADSTLKARCSGGVAGSSGVAVA